MPEKIRCPRCGHEQAPAEDCKKCGVNIPRYLELLKRRRAAPGGEAGQQTKPPSGPLPPPPEEEKPKEPKETPIPSTVPHKEQGTGVRAGLSDLGRLFSKTWELYKKRICTLVPIYILSFLLLIAFVGIFVGLGFIFSLASPSLKDTFLAGGGVVGMLAGLIALLWGQAALVFAAAYESIGIRDAFKMSWHRLGSFIWIALLWAFIIQGGIMLFLIPGVIFMVWFGLSIFVFASEGETGMNAFLKSKEYVRDRWFDVFLRLFVLWLVSIGIAIVPCVGGILSILFFPFMLLFVYLIYEELRTLKGEFRFEPSTGQKCKWLGISALGYVAAALIFILIIGSAVFLLFKTFQGIASMGGIKSFEGIAPRQNAPFSGDAMPSYEPAQDVWVYIYSVNYKGAVKLNGEELYKIKGEENMNYNYTTGSALRIGKNTFSIDYESIPGNLKPELRIKVSRMGPGDGKEDVIREWVTEKPSGRESFEVTIINLEEEAPPGPAKSI
jgi:hypothetical protein